MKHANVFLGLGSNLGDRKAYLQTAIDSIDAHNDIEIIAKSSMIETSPIGEVDQGKFINMVIEVVTSLTAERLLDVCLAIEQSNGRIREGKFGPRTLDIDILFFDNQSINSENLKVPHSEAHKRHFVLLPLQEIAPSFIHPTLDLSVEAMLGTL